MMGGGMTMGGFGSEGGGMGMSQGMGATPTKQGGYDELTLTPATIRQYQTATISDVEGRVLLDGVELKEVKLVGRVVEADPSDSALSVQMEDGTGRVRIKYWYPQATDGTTDGERKADMDATVTEGAFVSVSASVKTSNGRMILNGSTIKPLSDPNEITLHFVEAIHVHVDRTRRIPFSKGGSNPEGSAGGAGAGGQGAAAVTGFGMGAMQASATGFGMGSGAGSFGAGLDVKPVLGGGPAMGSTMGPGAGSSSSSAMSASGAGMGEGELQEVLKGILAKCTDDQGMAIVDLARQVQPRGVTEEAVRKAVDDLSMTGAVYSTTDDEHIKSTETD